MSDSPVVQASGVGFAYGGRRALEEVSFTVPAGCRFAFLGPNGSGKSTLFKLLATILPLSVGRLTVLGCDPGRDAAALRRRIGVVFQSPAVDRKLSVRQNLVYGGHLYGLRGAELQRRIGTMLDRTGLTERAADRVGELSGGLRRRVELAKGLLHQPELLLLDEPSTGLDPAARRELWALLRETPGLTVLFTTHLLDEADRADQALILDRGRMVASGTPTALKSSVGGTALEVVPAAADDLPELAATLGRLLQVEAVALDDRLRAQVPAAHRRVGEVVDALGDRVREVTVSPPSLEDVFFARTGATFEARER